MLEVVRLNNGRECRYSNGAIVPTPRKMLFVPPTYPLTYLHTYHAIDWVLKWTVVDDDDQ